MEVTKVQLVVVVCAFVLSLVLYTDSLFLPYRGDITLKQQGGQNYSFETRYSDTIYRTEKGSLVNGIWTVRGTYSERVGQYNIAVIEYLADDKGYRIINVKFYGFYPAPNITDATKKALLNST